RVAARGRRRREPDRRVARAGRIRCVDQRARDAARRPGLDGAAGGKRAPRAQSGAGGAAVRACRWRRARVPAAGDRRLIMHLDVRVQTGDFDVAAEYAALRRRLRSEAGAVASFVGLVRDLAPAAGAGPVRALYLEHYPGMTERSIGAIAEQAQQRWRL